jgi:hypothetical protein
MYMKPPLSIHHMRKRALTSVSKRMQAHATPQGSAGVQRLRKQAREQARAQATARERRR